MGAVVLNKKMGVNIHIIEVESMQADARVDTWTRVFLGLELLHLATVGEPT